MSRLLGVAGCQLQVMPGEVEKNLENMARQIEWVKYYSPWVKMVVAPELSIQGTSSLEKYAWTIPGPITDRCANIAKTHGIYFIPGSVYEKKGANIYNASPVFDDRGELITVYRKMYPWRPHEKAASGDRTVVFDMPGFGKIGICICYDLWFPELIRDLVVKGAEIVVIPTASGTQERAQETVLARAAAIQNQCFIVSVNGVGMNGSTAGGKGHSLIVDPEGNIVQKAGQLQENLIAMLDMDAVPHSRQFGIGGVTRPLASFFHEKHRFASQTHPFEKSPAGTENPFDEKTVPE
jgi:predicted amidohydrolase